MHQEPCIWSECYFTLDHEHSILGRGLSYYHEFKYFDLKAILLSYVLYFVLCPWNIHLKKFIIYHRTSILLNNKTLATGRIIISDWLEQGETDWKWILKVLQVRGIKGNKRIASDLRLIYDDSTCSHKITNVKEYKPILYFNGWPLGNSRYYKQSNACMRVECKWRKTRFLAIDETILNF